MGAYHKGEAAGAVFEAARTQFEAIGGFLGSEQAAAMSHGELEEWLQTGGRELLRLLFQGHLELRALREERQVAVVGSDGEVRTHVEASARDLMTVFGPVRVARPGVPRARRERVASAGRDAELAGGETVARAAPAGGRGAVAAQAGAAAVQGGETPPQAHGDGGGGL